jgi:hypothetical protein
MKMKMNGRKGTEPYVGKSSLVKHAAKTIQKTTAMREAAVDLTASMGFDSVATELATWDEDELRGLTVELAKELGMPKAKAVRLVAKLNSVAAEPAAEGKGPGKL